MICILTWISMPRSKSFLPVCPSDWVCLLRLPKHICWTRVLFDPWGLPKGSAEKCSNAKLFLHCRDPPPPNEFIPWLACERNDSHPSFSCSDLFHPRHLAVEVEMFPVTPNSPKWCVCVCGEGAHLNEVWHYQSMKLPPHPYRLWRSSGKTEKCVPPTNPESGGKLFPSYQINFPFTPAKFSRIQPGFQGPIPVDRQSEGRWPWCVHAPVDFLAIQSCFISR